MLVFIFSYLSWYDRLNLKVVCHRFLSLLGVSSIFRRDRHLELERCTFATTLPPIATFTNCFQNFHSVRIGSVCVKRVEVDDLENFWCRIGKTVAELDASGMILESESNPTGTEMTFYESFCECLSQFGKLKQLGLKYELAPIFVENQIVLPSVTELKIHRLNGDVDFFVAFMKSFPNVKRIMLSSIKNFNDDFGNLLLHTFAEKIKSLGSDVFRDRWNGERHWRITPELLLDLHDFQLEDLDCKRLSIDIRRFIGTQKRLKKLSATVSSFPIPVLPITHLNLSHIPVGLLDPCLEQYKTLQSLTYTAASYDPAAMKCIFKHQKHRLNELNLYDFHYRSCFLEEWEAMPQLERLGLFSVAEISVRGVRHLCRSCPNMKLLRLMGQFRGDPDRIVETICKELKQLEVFEIRLHEAGATSLTFEHIARYGKRLKMLGLGENEVEVLNSAKKFWLFQQLPMLREIRDFGSAYSKTRRTDYLIYTAQGDE